ncbi:Kynureninase [Chlamydiales bacterium SCGC AG-110-P3]|nr:Kynureninase [Chlamydiales bacterium SCGC AG-110-P3]
MSSMSSFYRDLFYIPVDAKGAPVAYFCGHSLGLQPRAAFDAAQDVLDQWKAKGVDGWFEGADRWMHLEEEVSVLMGPLVGGQFNEVAAMNTLTTNIHLAMASFYQPTKKCYKVLVDAPAFSSDTYAVRSHVSLRGYDPDDAIIEVTSCPGCDLLTMEDFKAAFDRHGDEVALVFVAGVNFLTGQLYDIQAITRLAHAYGCRVGFDLAHAVGNVPLALHDWDTDFAVWCCYKYLNGGPGSPGGLFVHQKMIEEGVVPGLCGWWGHDPSTRFCLQEQSIFVPSDGIGGWRVSTPPVLPLALLKASLQVFQDASFDALCNQSVAMTRRLYQGIEACNIPGMEIITPATESNRGCQLSLRIGSDAAAMQQKLQLQGYVCDYRVPDIIRLAPVSLYNTMEEVDAFCDLFADVVRAHGSTGA